MIVSCDGASRGNPGPAGFGVSITDPDGSVVEEIARGIGVATNNVAEYTAAIEGLRRAAELGASEVLLRSDSRLLIEQLSGRFRVKNPTLQRLHAEARSLAKSFRVVRYEHVPRERNTEADRLANLGVDEWLAAGGATRPRTESATPLWEEESGRSRSPDGSG
ncbi:MAG: ribonuclease HI family protein [Actinomycetota bacterium]|nr:ribonuclease HI family protein [Actinomycetota bacterium]